MKELHITDVETFLVCRRRWNWQSPLRHNLQQAALSQPLFIGQGVHVGLDAYHSNGDNPYRAIVIFRKWVLDRTKAITERSGPLWDAERKMINDSYRMGAALLKHYHLWRRSTVSNLEVVATEQKFKVAVPIPGTGQPSTQIYLAGRLDGIVRSPTGSLYPLEFKTARSLSNIHRIFVGLQGTIYTWAAKQLYGDEVIGIIYRILRKRIPQPPQPLQSGGFSQAKTQAKKTSFQYFKFRLQAHARLYGLNVRDLYRDNKKVLNLLHRRGMDEFFLEKVVYKPQATMDNAVAALYHVGKMMIDEATPIFATPPPWGCSYCPFRGPCALLEAGLPTEADAVLEAEYAPRHYWEDKNEPATKGKGTGA